MGSGGTRLPFTPFTLEVGALTVAGSHQPFTPLTGGGKLAPTTSNQGQGKGLFSVQRFAGACKFQQMKALLTPFGFPTYSTPLGKQDCKQGLVLYD